MMNSGQRRLQLPQLLVIDDQFGRSLLGSRFRNAVDPEVFSGYEADRKNLCTNFSLIDREGLPGDNALALAEATFCPSQIWNHSQKRIENSAESAKDAVRRGWPFSDGSRWALILLDLRFTYGPLDTFGDPQEGSFFGRDVLLSQLRDDFGPELPIVILSSTSREDNNQIVREMGALDFIHRVPGAGAPPHESLDSLKRILFQHGLLIDSTGSIIGKSLETLKMLRQARRAATSGRNTLLLGESGTGKGLLAEYIHRISAR